MASSNDERLDNILVAIHRLWGSDGTIDFKLARKKSWGELRNMVEATRDLEKKRQECIDNIAEQGQVLASFAHAMLRAAQTGDRLMTRQAYQDLARYCKILREE